MKKLLMLSMIFHFGLLILEDKTKKISGIDLNNKEKEMESTLMKLLILLKLINPHLKSKLKTLLNKLMYFLKLLLMLLKKKINKLLKKLLKLFITGLKDNTKWLILELLWMPLKKLKKLVLILTHMNQL